MRTELVATLLVASLVFAQQLYVPVLVDVAHGEATKGLDLWVNATANELAISDFAKLYVLAPPGSQLDPLLQKLEKAKLITVVNGDFSTVDLSQFKVIVLGQPPKPLTEAELSALKKWFDEGGKVLWCAADSDYPAQGSEESQLTCNDLAEYLGAHIRVDYVSVEDSQHNARAGYRVVGVIDPPPPLAFLGFMAQRVLFHGPGVVAVVLPNGTWVPATSPEVQKYYNNIYVIARTTQNGVIVEHRTSADGKGRDGKAHRAGDRGVFALMAAEFMPSGSVLILSGETPYGGYEPGVVPSYYGVKLDGPRFFRNLMLWATGNYRELSTFIQQTQAAAQLSQGLSSVSADLQTVKNDVQNLRSGVAALQGDLASVKNTVGQVNSQVGGLASQVNNVAAQVDALSQKVDQLSKQLEAATAEAANARTTAFVGTALALVFAIIAALLAVKKGKAATEATKTR
ncbi:MAG: ABC transporter [Pyrobaculum sp.]